MFWDSSAIVPLIVPERRSADLSTALAADREVTVWWGARIECVAALHRRQRESPMPVDALRKAVDRLRALAQDADTIPASDDVRRRAERLLGVHPLRAADALQLAAALVWCEDDPSGDTFVCLDDRLRDAAHREGFSLLPA